MTTDPLPGVAALVDGASYRAALAFAADPSGDSPAVRAAVAVRRLTNLATGTAAPDDVLDDVAAAAAALADRLAPYAESSRFPQGERLGGAAAIFVTHPIIGATNPGAPPLKVEPDGARLVGRATYGPLHEGPPGFVHGGLMAAAFDAMVVMTAGINGLGGMTRSLAIRYRRPAPIGVELVYAGVVEAPGERSTKVKVELRHGDDLCAECTGDVATRPR
jgi:acyl-coenzyme A thioesterase PaaI-like protein